MTEIAFLSRRSDSLVIIALRLIRICRLSRSNGSPPPPNKSPTSLGIYLTAKRKKSWSPDIFRLASKVDDQGYSLHFPSRCGAFYVYDHALFNCLQFLVTAPRSKSSRNPRRAEKDHAWWKTPQARAENNILRKLYSSRSQLTFFEVSYSHYDRPERSQGLPCSPRGRYATPVSRLYCTGINWMHTLGRLLNVQEYSFLCCLVELVVVASFDSSLFFSVAVPSPGRPQRLAPPPPTAFLGHPP
ncbi:hypothetical protein HZ326_16067 [Fusarium oxysporum f. sp. albedinis]|nr:hypothetical protein HZ326_16067 [Fusarium oxysporum f. sp. albedinis]